MGVTSPVSEILLLLKTAKFPFLTMGYSPWLSKIESNRIGSINSCKWGDVKCMHTKFSGCSFFGFGDIATFKNGQISINYIVHVGQKIHASREMHAV